MEEEEEEEDIMIKCEYEIIKIKCDILKKIYIFIFFCIINYVYNLIKRFLNLKYHSETFS